MATAIEFDGFYMVEIVAASIAPIAMLEHTDNAPWSSSDGNAGTAPDAGTTPDAGVDGPVVIVGVSDSAVG